MLELGWTSSKLDDASRGFGLLVDEIVRRADGLVPSVERGETEAAITLHPAAAPVMVRVRGDHLEVEADTGTTGPGYHQEVRAIVDAAAERASITWAKQTAPQDRAKLEATLDAWLADTATQVLQSAAGGATGFSILLPEGIEYAHTSMMATPLGPRDRAWLERVQKTKGVAGRDVFPWWDAGRGAGYFSGLARTLAWTEVRWRSPLDDRERALNDRVVTAIERAHGLDSSLELPWLEAAELYELLGEESLRATRAGVLAEAARKRGVRAMMGYRRGAVRVSLSGGWSLVVPGDLAERWEEHGTWVGWDRSRTVWISSMTAEGTDDTNQVLADLPPLPGDGELLRMERGPIVGHARFEMGEEDGRPIAVMRAHAAFGKHVALGTIILPSDVDRTWALETWGTLDRDDLGA